MKKVFLCFLGALLLLITFFSFLSPNSRKNQLTLMQPDAEIQQIDLGYSPWRENQIIYTLDHDEFDGFLKELRSIKVRKNLNPKGEYGSLYVQITYADGAVEVLGSLSCFYFKGDTKQHDGWYYLLEDELYSLFSKYVRIPS